MGNKIEICEICGHNDFWEYKYPLDIKPFISRVARGSARRYFVNIAKFILRLIIKLLPFLFSNKFKTRVVSPYKRLQSFKESRHTIKNIETGMQLFISKNILICKKCNLGTISPKIPEDKLIEHYKQDYWVAGVGEIEPFENNRTSSTYGLLSQYIDFNNLDEILEFGSASAQLSRYLKTKQPNLTCDSIDPGLVWKDALSGNLRNIYRDVKLIQGQYSLLMGSHSLEHVSDVMLYFKKFTDLIKKDGYLYFEVPNSTERDLIFGEKPDFHFPHTYFFTQESFNEIAKKFNLEVVFNKTFSRSYSQLFNGVNKEITPIQENPNGSYLRILLKKK